VLSLTLGLPPTDGAVLMRRRPAGMPVHPKTLRSETYPAFVSRQFKNSDINPNYDD
jgi:hypothetical protein